MNLPKHKFWGAGEPDCPQELKAPNGELHTMRCKVCGDGWRESNNVCLPPGFTLLQPTEEEIGAAVRAAAAGVGAPAPAGWWTEELERIFTATRGTVITDDMKRAAGIALQVARGQRWDDARQEWTDGVAIPQNGQEKDHG